MQRVNLLDSLKASTSSLEAFATELFSAFSATEYERRESSNYLDGHYFKGTADGLRPTVCISDEQSHEDLPYWIQISADTPTLESLVDAVDHMVREKALPARFKIARINNFGNVMKSGLTTDVLDLS